MWCGVVRWQASGSGRAVFAFASSAGGAITCGATETTTTTTTTTTTHVLSHLSNPDLINQLMFMKQVNISEHSALPKLETVNVFGDSISATTAAPSLR